MKTRSFLFAIMASFVMSIGVVNAQDAQCPMKKDGKKPSPEQMIDMRVARMQKQLVLDDATAAKFAPLYKEYLNELKGCCPKAGECNVAGEKKQKCTKKAEMTDADVIKSIENRFEAQQKMLDTKKKYYSQFKKILNARQLDKVFSCNMKSHKPGHMAGHKPAQKPCQKSGPAASCKQCSKK